MSFPAISRFLALIAFGIIMSGCITSVFSISYPAKGGSYVGMYGAAAPSALDGTTPLAQDFEIKFDKAPSSDVQILLNGHNISKYFVFGSTNALGEVAKFKHFFRQGKNTLSVDPFGFGPTHIFSVDTAGPAIIVTEGTMGYQLRTVTAYNPQGAVSGVDTNHKEPKDVVIKGFLRDPSSVDTSITLELYKIIGYQSNGKLNKVLHSTYPIAIDEKTRAFQSDAIDISSIIEDEIWFNHDADHRTADVIANNDEYYENLPSQLAGKGSEKTKKVALMYSFRARDAHGYESTREYLADSEHAGTLGVDNAVRVAIGGSVVESLRPLIAAAMAAAMETAPIHAKCAQVGKEEDPRTRRQGEFKDGMYELATSEYYDQGNNRVYPKTALEVVDMNAVTLAPESCLYWDSDRVCNGVNGVVSGRNITQVDFDAQALGDSDGDDTTVDGKTIAHGDFACKDNPTMSKDTTVPGDTQQDGSVTSFSNTQDGSRAGGGPMYLPIELLGMVIKFDAFLRETILLNGDPEITLAGEKKSAIGGTTISGKHGTMLLNNFTIKADDTLNVQMEITHMAAGLTMVGNSPLGGIITIDMAMYIGYVSVDADAIVSAKGKKVDVSLDPDNTNIAMSGLAIDEMDACMSSWFGPICIGIPSWLINPIINPLMGMIGGMIPGIANPIIAANLQKISIGGAVAGFQDGTEFEMTMNVAELGTAAAASDFDLVAGLESVADITSADPHVTPALGPIFKDDPVNPGDVLNGIESGGDSNLTVAISSNFINQGLAAVYATGSSHITFYKGKMYYGAHPLMPGKLEDDTKLYLEDLDGAAGDGTNLNDYVATIAKKGETRIRLWPDMPPALSFSEVVGSAGAGLAKVTYESATIYYDELIDDAGQLKWATKLSLSVDFDLGVTIDEDNGAFTMGSGGPPSFNINEMKNFTNIQIPPVIVQGVLDVALLLGGDFLADKFLVLDLNKIAGAALNKDAGGTEFTYRSTTDLYTQTNQEDETGCIVYGVDPITGKDTLDVVETRGNTVLGDDKISDVVCKKVSFDVSTNNVGTIGAYGSNLFFQMKVIDANFPRSFGLPKVDLDEDGNGKFDYQDNCAVSRSYLSTAVDTIKTAEGWNEIQEVVTVAGKDVIQLKGGEATVNRIRAEVNKLLAKEFGASRSESDLPTVTDIENWDGLRKGDPVFGDLASLGAYPWIKLLYSNPGQLNLDGDRVGELCESDFDFDGVYDDNLAVTAADNCPSVANTNQLDTSAPDGVGDACNIRSNFVMIRSLGSRYTDAGNANNVTSANYKCLTHSNYKNQSSTIGGVTYSADMNNSSAATIADCNPWDVGQRWYLQKVDGFDTNDTTINSTNNFSIFADTTRNNQTSWQLGSYLTSNNANRHLKMARMNAANKYWSGASEGTRPNIGGLWNLSRYVRPAVAAKELKDMDEFEREEITHPWILAPYITLKGDQQDCLFYNTNGYGPDFDVDVCITDAFPQGASPHPSIPNDKYYRWGIYIQGDQLWNGEW